MKKLYAQILVINNRLRAYLERLSFQYRLIKRKVLIRKAKYWIYSWHKKTWHLKDEPPLSWMLDRIAAQDVIYDIGANRGYFSLAVLSNCPQAKVYSFEPNPHVYKLLNMNIHLNGWADRGIAVCSALGDHQGKKELFISLADSASSFHAHHSASAGWNICDQINVPVATIDHLVNTQQMPSPQHIKIDTEGFESQILHGASNTLKTGRPILYIEIHNIHALGQTNEAEIVNLLNRHHYEIIKQGNQLLGIPGNK